MPAGTYTARITTNAGARQAALQLEVRWGSARGV